MNAPVLTRVAPGAVDYPSSDGKPMAESDDQRAAMIYAIDALETWFAEREDVYVSGDLLIYYKEGNPGASIAPDVFVVFGAGKWAAADVPAVGRREGAGLRAGGGVAEYVARG